MDAVVRYLTGVAKRASVVQQRVQAAQQQLERQKRDAVLKRRSDDLRRAEQKAREELAAKIDAAAQAAKAELDKEQQKAERQIDVQSKVEAARQGILRLTLDSIGDAARIAEASRTQALAELRIRAAVAQFVTAQAIS